MKEGDHMLSIYPACFFKEENGYSVVFPDLNYLSTCGENEQEAMEMAVDCLAGYLFSGGEALLASELKDISLEKVAKELEVDAKDGYVTKVSVDVKEYAKTHFQKSVKKTLSIPRWLNDAALEKNINFSQTLQEALLLKIKA